MQTLKNYMANYPLNASQRDWADFFGISQSYLSQILTGARSPSKELMKRIEKKTRGAVPIIVWFTPPTTTHEDQIDAA